MSVGRGDDHLVDQLRIRVDRNVGLVAIEAAIMGLMTVAGLRVDRGDHPVGRHSPGDTEHPVVASVDVLAGDDSQQLHGVGRRARQRLGVERLQRRQAVPDQRVDERLLRLGIVPVADRLARTRVIVIAGQHRPHPDRQGAIAMIQRPQQLADCGAQLRHRVLGGHRVVDRRRVEHPHPLAHQPGLDGHRLDVFEQPPRPFPYPQPVPQTDQGRRVERHRRSVDPSRGLPGQVPLQAVARLLVRQALMGLEQHHRGQHPRRDRGATPSRLLVQVCEVVVTEEPVAVIGQQPVDPPQPIT